MCFLYNTKFNFIKIAVQMNLGVYDIACTYLLSNAKRSLFPF